MKKIILVGDYYVGKTCIVTTLLNGPPKDQQPYIPTVATSTYFYERGGEKYQIWDTAGQEQYRSLVGLYMRGADISILVFDLTIRSTFESIPNWINILRSNLGENHKILIACNKSDLVDKRLVTREEIEEFCNKENIEFFETSAITGNGIYDLFDQAISIISNNQSQPAEVEEEHVDLKQEETVKKDS